VTGRPQNRRLWLGGGAVVAVLILLVAWFGFISPELASTASIHDQAAAAQSQNEVLQLKNQRLKSQNDSAAGLRADLAAELKALPSESGLPAFTRQLSAEATANSVTLTSVVVGAVAPVGAAAGQSAAAAASAATSVATTASVTPVASTGSLVQIPVTVIATGLGKNDIAFLKAIQVIGPRRALVTASQLAPIGSGAATGVNGPCTLTLTLTIFSAPLTPAAQADLQKLISGK
jgi:hypothetical protein